MPRLPRAFSAVFLFVLALALVAAGGAAATPGDFDTSFGNGGFAAAALGSNNAYMEGLAIAAGGRVFVSGYALTSPNTLALAAFTPAGALDASFNSGLGYTEAAAGSANTESGYVAVQSDGSAVVAGLSFSGAIAGYTLMRFGPGGAADAGFGSGGVETAYPSPGIRPFAVLLAPGNEIVTVSQSSGAGNDLWLAKYLSNGQPDNSFGTSGAADIPVAGGGNTWMNATVGPNGSTYVVGAHYDGTSYHFITAKLTPGGALDPGFGGGTGYVIGRASGDIGVSYAAVQPDGKLVAAGAANVFGGNFDTFTLVRYNADGSLDSSFGQGGYVPDPFSDQYGSWPEGLAVMPDGRIVALAQYFDTASTQAVAAVRYLADGSRDPSFGTSGARVLSLPANTAVKSLALQSDGKIVIAGDGPVPPANTQNGMYVFRLDNSVPSPAAPAYTPTARITSPSTAKLKARKLKRFAGTAGPDGQVANVEIALREMNPKLLKRKRQCLWLASSKGRFAKRRDPTKKCSPAKALWLTASGTTNWSYRLKHTLKKGKYRLYVRVTLLGGSRTTVFSAAAGTLKPFKLN